ncbi:unnamed protein product [Ambrosiozyma monospora]|uniref:Unnamed protein product n=1 Tax=Ambrosiozyma monospora TaxID=43982 RepID=A0ACB5U8W3_AMBMO|nr:unnamed protein product [Ambrosiozyma monospora]
MNRALSVSDLTFIVNKDDSQPLRTGILASAQHLDDADEALTKGLASVPKKAHNDLINVMNLVVGSTAGYENDSQILEQMRFIVDENKSDLHAAGIRRLSFVLGGKVGTYPKYFTFKSTSEKAEYVEDQVIRHIEPALAFQLELELFWC